MLLRTAVADDADGLADLIYLADLAHYTTSGYALSIGGTKEHQLAEIAKLVSADARSPFHFTHFDVAEVPDGSIAASVAGFDRTETDPQMIPALEEIGWDAHTIEQLTERIGPVAACVPEQHERAWTIEHVATLPLYRGQGLAPRLLARALARGAERGYGQATVDVFIGNSKARAIYEAAGFTKTCEFGHGPMREILGRDAVERMMRPLAGTILAGTIKGLAQLN